MSSSMIYKQSYDDWSYIYFNPSFCCGLIQDLDEAMKKTTAAWKIAVGHHTMRSVSDHGDTKELLQLLLPVLQV